MSLWLLEVSQWRPDREFHSLVSAISLQEEPGQRGTPPRNNSQTIPVRGGRLDAANAVVTATTSRRRLLMFCLKTWSDLVQCDSIGEYAVLFEDLV